jgi:hypothetical protein
LIAAFAVALASASASPAHAATPSAMFGVSVNRVFNDDFVPSHWDAPLAAVRASGLRQARSDAFWMWAETRPPVNGKHTYRWAWLDFEALALAKHDLRWLPILDYSALWAASDRTDYHSPPTSNDDYAAYAGGFAARYGRGGSFWSQHPDLDPQPVTTYEIWNEPNGAWFWKPGPNPTAYADMYIKARKAIRAVDPQATVMIGGIAGDTRYVAAMYRARPELHGNVDALGWHAYAPTADLMIAEVKEVRRTLESLGEGGVPIHLTEVGWPTRGHFPFVMSEETRAASLEKVADWFARSDCGVEAVVPYTWTTPERNPAQSEDWYGIRRPDGSPTPTSDAFERVVARWDADPVTDATRMRLCHPPDADRDGVPDAQDPDDDNDAVPDASDALPFDPAESSDLDRDGIGDNGDADDDGDGSPDELDAFPLDPGESTDADLDGKGDNADRDDDNDGLKDGAERLAGTSAVDVDSDDDGLSDASERRTSPIKRDTDRDHIPDGVEKGVVRPLADPPGAARGTNRRRFQPDRDARTRTSAVRADTDHDCVVDGWEDRNRNGRRDRGESDPLKRKRRARRRSGSKRHGGGARRAARCRAPSRRSPR